MMTATQNHPDPNGPDPSIGPDPTTTRPVGQPRPWGRRSKVPGSRMGTAWVALLAAACVLLLLLIFILQNSQRADVSFFGVHGHLPMGVALLLAAIFGVLLVALPGTVRIIQLRMLGRRRSRQAEPESGTPPAAPDDPTAR